MLRVPRPKLPRGLPHPIPEHDLAVALDTAPERIRPWMLLAAYAGLRAFEVAPLRGQDLWWHVDPPLVVVEDGKGGDQGAVPLAPILQAEFNGYPQRGWLFPRCDGRPGPLRGHNVSHQVNQHLHRLGMPWTMHSLRHRFGTMVQRAGRDVRHTQELLRHRSITSTQRYTLVDRDEAAGIVASLPAPLRSVS